jgi:uncharacterized DUF497 family protein
MAKAYRWDPEKNALLLQTHGFGFEEVVDAIDANRVITDIANPSLHHPDQRLLIVEINGYAIGVPYVSDGDTMFFKTAFQSRKLKRIYLEH